MAYVKNVHAHSIDQMKYDRVIKTAEQQYNTTPECFDFETKIYDTYHHQHQVMQVALILTRHTAVKIIRTPAHCYAKITLGTLWRTDREFCIVIEVPVTERGNSKQYLSCVLRKLEAVVFKHVAKDVNKCMKNSAGKSVAGYEWPVVRDSRGEIVWSV